MREYACPVWHNSLTNEQCHQIESIQRCALKIICGQNNTTYNEFKLSSLADRRSVLCKAFLKSLFLMPIVVYTICYLLQVQILYTDLDSIYHTFRKYLKLRDIITLSYPMLLIVVCLLVHSPSNMYTLQFSANCRAYTHQLY